MGTKNVRCLAICGNNIFAGTAGSGDGVYLSTDNGASWTHTALYNETFSLAVWGNNIFAGTASSGIYMSTNNGSNWIQKNQGLSNLEIIYALFISNNYIFAGTYGQSVWRRSIPEITGVNSVSTEVPSSFSLSQNYPNPFNPNTIIKFQIKESRFVTLKIFDALGKEVATLVNEKQSPGMYEVDWNAGNYPSGVYYYTLTAGDFRETKKMLMIK